MVPEQKSGETVGYEYLRRSLNLTSLPPAKPALIRPVTRVEDDGTYLSVPRHVAPPEGGALHHLLFALKHEGTDLTIISQAVKHLDVTQLRKALWETPNGGYIRKACYFWERFTGNVLEDIPAPGGIVVPVFSPSEYLTRSTKESTRDQKWRIDFNGLGTLAYNPMVRRTQRLKALLRADIMGQVDSFIEETGPELLDRALAWAYLHETEGSYALERESPPEDKARAFASLLRQAHEPRTLTEEYLVELQNAVISNPYEKAVQFRTEQNWLKGPARGAAGVSYVPPPPELAYELMAQLQHLAALPPKSIDPLVQASIASFGFVFIHPFMDGNGRLSRWLFHHSLCQSGRLRRGAILPVSIAMKRNEEAYLAALTGYSRPMRDRWLVRWIDEDKYEFTFQADAALYRYWDATKCVEFGLEMAQQALQRDLRQETEFLAGYDTARRVVEARFDIRSEFLSNLLVSCFQNQGTLSKNRRKQYVGRVPETAFDVIESAVRQAMQGQPQEDSHHHEASEPGFSGDVDP
jgi:Fic/DOC family